MFDVIIIGAGVVGCAMARRFTLEGAHVALIEKAADILDGASKANSAILHTGFDAPPGSIELSCITEGYREYCDIYSGFGLPFEKSGAHVVAWSDDELAKLEQIIAQAHANGVKDVALISAAQLRQAEPQLADHARGAAYVPGEGIIDPWSAPYAYLRQSVDNGGEIFLECELTGGNFAVDHWQLQTSRGSLRARHVINCAGLYGDRVDQTMLGSATYEIKPRKGQFVIFDKAASRLLNSIILPIPTALTKGVVLFRTVFGNLGVGPTAEEQDSRVDAATDEEALRGLIEAGVQKLPALAAVPVTAVYAGLRPATQFKDYQIAARSSRNWITVGGIRSTGLSGALGIAQYVFKLYQKMGVKHAHLTAPTIPRVSVLAEAMQRDWQCKDHDDIVCHCELVTRREIRLALSGPLKARSLAGLKRQTRVTMGRCQGFYCTAQLARMTRGCFVQSMARDIGDE